MYVTHDGLGPVLEGLYKEGYIALQTAVTAPHEYEGNEIERVITLGNSTHKIDVVVSRMSLSIAPIFQFHSSVVMNYVSVDTFFSAYPSLTMESIGLSIHSSSFGSG